MIIVKSKAMKKEWHFWHSEKTLCTGSRDTALHNYAMQVLMERKVIMITKKLSITYIEPRREVVILGMRSDVAVKYENEDVHFEIFVSLAVAGGHWCLLLLLVAITIRLFMLPIAAR